MNYKGKEVIGLYVLVIIAIILMLIQKFPIEIQRIEKKQIWEANCNCECITQEPKPCLNWNFSIEKPKSYWVNFSYILNMSEECRFCWKS